MLGRGVATAPPGARHDAAVLLGVHRAGRIVHECEAERDAAACRIAFRALARHQSGCREQVHKRLGEVHRRVGQPSTEHPQGQVARRPFADQLARIVLEIAGQRRHRVVAEFAELGVTHRPSRDRDVGLERGVTAAKSGGRDGHHAHHRAGERAGEGGVAPARARGRQRGGEGGARHRHQVGGGGHDGGPKAHGVARESVGRAIERHEAGVEHPDGRIARTDRVREVATHALERRLRDACRDRRRAARRDGDLR